MKKCKECGQQVKKSIENKTKLKKPRKIREKTIRRVVLARMSHCNSSKLPKIVKDGDKYIQWVGIGWIEISPSYDERNKAVKIVG